MMPGDYVLIRVQDNGCGIAEDILPRIFEPYYTTKNQGEGTGLGLAVVHGIVKSHNGSIHVHSIPDKGTSVEVYLPAVRKSAQTRANHTKTETEAVAVANAHIMIVDDESAILDIASAMLRNTGYVVTTVDNATEALAKFKAQPDLYDLLLLDMTMPRVNGDQLAAQMRTIRANIPVVLFSGYNKRLVGQTAESLGVSAILSKPFHQAELAHAIRKAMGATPSSPSAPSVDDHTPNTRPSTFWKYL
jgi:CheY-like chemotaxis protein